VAVAGCSKLQVLQLTAPYHGFIFSSAETCLLLALCCLVMHFASAAVLLEAPFHSPATVVGKVHGANAMQ
jgi:hypothetical protein